MPVNLTTPIAYPDDSHVWIHTFTTSGLEPGGSPRIQMDLIFGHDTDPPNEVWAVERVETHALEGQDAIDFIVANQTLYDDLKVALYNKLIADGVITGTIE